MQYSINNLIATDLLNPAFDLTVDYAELSLDEFISNDALKDIPIIKTIIGVYKGVDAIKRVHFAKNLLSFLKQLHDGVITTNELEEFCMRLNADEKYRAKVLENVAVMMDRFVAAEKAKLYGNIFIAHIKGKLTWEQMSIASECVDGFNLAGLKFLSELVINNGEYVFLNGGVHKLEGVGLLMAASLAFSVFNSGWGLSSYGVSILYYGVKRDYTKSFDELKLLTKGFSHLKNKK